MKKHALRFSALSLVVLFVTPATAQAQGQGLESAPTRAIRITTKEVTDRHIERRDDEAYSGNSPLTIAHI